MKLVESGVLVLFAEVMMNCAVEPGIPGTKLAWAPLVSPTCPKYSQRKPRFSVRRGVTFQSSWK